MTQQQEKVTEKALKWIKMKRCVGIHSSEMTVCESLDLYMFQMSTKQPS